MCNAFVCPYKGKLGYTTLAQRFQDMKIDTDKELDEITSVRQEHTHEEKDTRRVKISRAPVNLAVFPPEARPSA